MIIRMIILDHWPSAQGARVAPPATKTDSASFRFLARTPLSCLSQRGPRQRNLLARPSIVALGVKEVRAKFYRIVELL